MTIKVVVYFSTLCRLAREEYAAMKSGDLQAWEAAKKAHADYKELCRTADEMVTPHERRTLR